MADSSDEPDVAPSSSTDVDALAHRLEAWFWRKGPARGKAQARDARGRFLPKPKVVESNTQQASTTPFFTTLPLYFMSPSFSPMSEASSSSFPSQVCPPNLLQAFTMPNPSPLWVAGAHASLATRCLQLLDALASVLVVASSPSSSPPVATPFMNHTVFTQPPYAEATTSFPCLLVDPKAVDAHPHMELNKGYLRLWLTTHTKDGRVSEYAQRLVLWAIRGPPSLAQGGWEGSVAMHQCHTPLCVHPLHLKWGTRQENLADRPRAIN